MIKKFYTSMIMAMMVAVAIPALAGSAAAQGPKFDKAAKKEAKLARKAAKHYNKDQARYGDQYGTYGGYNDNYRYDEPYVYDGYEDPYSRPNVYDRHRKAINIGVATGAGAVIGAMIGGKKGALIGAAGGAVTGAIITAKQRPRNTERIYRY